MIYNLVNWPVSLPKKNATGMIPPRFFSAPAHPGQETRSQAPKPQILMRKTCGFPRRSRDGERWWNPHWIIEEISWIWRWIILKHQFHHTFHHISPHFTTFHLLCHAYHHSNFYFGGLTRSWPSAVGSSQELTEKLDKDRGITGAAEGGDPSGIMVSFVWGIIIPIWQCVKTLYPWWTSK